MNFHLSPTDLLLEGRLQNDLLVVLVREGFDAGQGKAGGLYRVMAQAMKAGHWTPAQGKRLNLYLPQDAAAAQVILLGTGKGSAADVRDALGKVLKEQVGEGGRLAVYFAQDTAADQMRAAMLAVGSAGYVYSAAGTSQRTQGFQRIVLGAPDAARHKQAFAEGKALVAGMTLAREWANRPSNVATPAALSQAAREIVKNGNAASSRSSFSCAVLNEAQVRKLGMGAFLSVAKGSDEPLKFIVMQYQGAAAGTRPLVFVGKGITFDSGGISLKPGAGMDEMKFDMCGAASVLGLFESLRHLKPKANVVGLIPACENMPSGRATKPGDVVTSMSGQTIEVLNTDAEGRLILCDALTYAERFKPLAVVDVATLTGNCVLALGNVRTGLFSQHDALAGALQRAADESADLCWRMPMDDVYGKGLKSNFADMANIAGRTAGAISAAKFLERFTGQYPWAHLDIAGTAWDEGAAKGATGRPVPMLLQFVLNMAESPLALTAAKPDIPAATPAKKRHGKSAGGKSAAGKSAAGKGKAAQKA